MPRMNGLNCWHIRNRGDRDTVGDICHCAMADTLLRLGAGRCLLKPAKIRPLARDGFARLCSQQRLIPALRVIRPSRLMQQLITAAAKITGTKPPFSRFHRRVNYRQQLPRQTRPGVDIAALSENDLAFYCLMSPERHNGVLATCYWLLSNDSNSYHQNQRLL